MSMADARITCQEARSADQQHCNHARQSLLASNTASIDTSATASTAPVARQLGRQTLTRTPDLPSPPPPVSCAISPRSFHSPAAKELSYATLPRYQGARRLEPVLEKPLASSDDSRQSSCNSLAREAINEIHYNATPVNPRSGKFPSGRPLSERSHEDRNSRHILRSLVHLSSSAPLLSLGVCLYSLVVLVVTGLATISRICFIPKGYYSRLLRRGLLPPLNLQRRCIALPPLSLPPLGATEEGRRSSCSEETDYLSACSSYGASYTIGGCSPPRLIITHVASPLVSLPLALVAMMTTIYWSLSVMIANEQAGGQGDEVRFAERIVRFWETWLDWSLEI